MKVDMVGVGRMAVVGAGWGNPDLLPRPKKVLRTRVHVMYCTVLRTSRSS